MSRSDQHIGLTDEAWKFLKDNEIKLEVCSECNRPYYTELEVNGTYSVCSIKNILFIAIS